MGSEPQTISAWGTHLRAHGLAASVCFVVLGRGEQSCTRGPCPTPGVQLRHRWGLGAPSGSFHLSGRAWPAALPALSGSSCVPGLTSSVSMPQELVAVQLCEAA